MDTSNRSPGLVTQTRLRLYQIIQTRRAQIQDRKALRGQVLDLALPAAGERVLSMMVSIVDTILVGHLGAASLAAVSLSSQWVFVAMTLFDALSTGATAIIARAIGAGDPRTANRALHQSLVLSILVGLLATIPAELLAEQAMLLSGATSDTLAEGMTFMRINAAVFTLQSVMFVGNACLRGAGNTRAAMIVMTVVNVVNVIVASITIYGPFGLPRLGVAGSALGAAAGRTIGAGMVLWMLARGSSGLKLNVRDWLPDWSLMRRILHIGVPTGLERGFMRGGQMVFLRTVSQLGTIALAAHAVALRAESLSFMPGFGFGVAGTTLVGQNLGAGKPRRAEEGGYITFNIAVLLMTALGLVFILLPRPLVRMFSSDPAVVEAAVTPLRIVGFVQPMLAATMVFPGCLRGAGDTRAPMYITSASIWAIRVPLGYLLSITLGLGLNGAWLAMVIDMTVRGAFFFFRYRSGKWKTIRVLEHGASS